MAKSRSYKAPTTRPAIIWFREDLRLSDNRALTAAAESGAPLLAIYVFDQESAGIRPLGGASRWWLHHSLASLSADLGKLNIPLRIYRGKAGEIVTNLAEANNCESVFWSRRYGYPEREVDKRVKSSLQTKGISAESFNDHLLFEPWEVTTKSGDAFRVFTPFWRAARSFNPPSKPCPKPRSLIGFHLEEQHGPVTSKDLALLPTKPDWSAGLRETWTPGEKGAQNRLARFLAECIAQYASGRDQIDKPFTSSLSPHLRFGEISARQLWHAAQATAEVGSASHGNVEKFLSELGWREFAHHVLFHHPDLATRNFSTRFNSFPWKNDQRALKSWRRGQTGIPIVDAGMRELWKTGVMHNRARMIVASFLVKHLMIDWREGEAWFWDTLVDADPANNPFGWQWIAGSGADAAPYFRIFNPVLQGEKFDPDGGYVRRWVPELDELPTGYIHRPWAAPMEILRNAGVALGANYPLPIVDLAEGRSRALAAFQAMRN